MRSMRPIYINWQEIKSLLLLWNIVIRSKINNSISEPVNSSLSALRVLMSIRVSVSHNYKLKSFVRYQKARQSFHPTLDHRVCKSDYCTLDTKPHVRREIYHPDIIHHT